MGIYNERSYGRIGNKKKVNGNENERDWNENPKNWKLLLHK